MFDIFKAFSAGKEVANPALWKNVGNLANNISLILSLGVGAYRVFIGPLPITDDDLIKISSGLASLLFAANSIIATVTTKKNVSVLGIPKDSTSDK